MSARRVCGAASSDWKRRPTDWYDVSGTALVCLGGAGFSPDLRTAAGAGQAVLAGLDDLYHGIGPG